MQVPWVGWTDYRTEQGCEARKPCRETMQIKPKWGGLKKGTHVIQVKKQASVLGDLIWEGAMYTEQVDLQASGEEGDGYS